MSWGSTIVSSRGVPACVRGHGDVVIVATPLPADRSPRATVTRQAVRMDNPHRGGGRQRHPLGSAAGHLRGRLRRPHGDDGLARRGPTGAGRGAGGDRPGGRPVAAHGGHRALRVLRIRADGLCGHPDGRATVLGLLHAPKGGHPARRLRSVRRPDVTTSHEIGHPSPAPHVAGAVAIPPGPPARDRQSQPRAACRWCSGTSRRVQQARVVCGCAPTAPRSRLMASGLTRRQDVACAPPTGAGSRSRDW